MQVLCRAASSDKDPMLLDIYTSTEAIFFLGTPHRGSNQAETAENIRRIVSASGFDAPDQNLKALQVNSAELERIHEYFMKLYEQQDRYPFKVITFREGKGFVGINNLSLNKRVSCFDKPCFRCNWLTVCTAIRLSRHSPHHSLVQKQLTQLMQTICLCAAFKAKLMKVTSTFLERCT